MKKVNVSFVLDFYLDKFPLSLDTIWTHFIYLKKKKVKTIYIYIYNFQSITEKISTPNKILNSLMKSAKITLLSLSLFLSLSFTLSLSFSLPLSLLLSLSLSLSHTHTHINQIYMKLRIWNWEDQHGRVPPVFDRLSNAMSCIKAIMALFQESLQLYSSSRNSAFI